MYVNVRDVNSCEREEEEKFILLERFSLEGGKKSPRERLSFLILFLCATKVECVDL